MHRFFSSTSSGSRCSSRRSSSLHSLSPPALPTSCNQSLVRFFLCWTTIRITTPTMTPTTASDTITNATLILFRVDILAATDGRHSHVAVLSSSAAGHSTPLQRGSRRHRFFLHLGRSAGQSLHGVPISYGEPPEVTSPVMPKLHALTKV